MKKYLSFFSFIALFFIGMQFSSAQDAERQQNPEDIAKHKTNEIHQLVKLDEKQFDAIFNILLDAEKNMEEFNQDNISEERKEIGMDVVSKNITANFKKILTPEQYKTYEESLIKK